MRRATRPRRARGVAALTAGLTLLHAVSADASPLPAGEPGAPPTAAFAGATPELSARFALIVGVNNSVDKDAQPLRYADDDAAGFLDLFRALSARTYLLSRFDENTRRLHPQAFAEAQEPRRHELERVVEQLAADVAKARERHVPSVLYVVYAGHGNVEGGRGYLALEDARLFGGDLERLIVDRVRADQTHVIVDACYSVFLALSRSPGGEREESHGFSSLGGLASRPDVGLLLSTSSARESHEWSEFQAGIFSHEVRSGLLGAADSNRDGEVTYRELAAFVDRANAAIPNEKFRPDVYAKEPTSTAAILDLRAGLGRRLELSGHRPGHYLLEDARGVRLADFNDAPGQPLNLIRVASAGPLFLRRVDGEGEYVVSADSDVQRLDDLIVRPTSTQARGAAHESFSLLFALPFSQANVDGFVVRRFVPDAAPRAPSRALRRPVGLALLGAGALGAAAGTWAVLSALSIEGSPATTQKQHFGNNEEIARRNTQARWLYGLGAAAAGTGAVLLLWPRLTGTRSAITVAPALELSGLTLTGAF